MLQREHSGNGCDLALTLCKYALRKGDLFVLIWEKDKNMSEVGEVYHQSF